MRRQRRVELRRVQVRKFDPPTGELLVGGLGDRAAAARRQARVRVAVRSLTAVRSWLTVATRGQLRVMLIGSLSRLRRDDADLIQRQSTLLHALGAARERLKPARDGGDRVRVRRRRGKLPGHQRRDRPRARGAAESRRDRSRRRSPRCAHRSRCADRPTSPTPRTAPQDAQQGSLPRRSGGRGHNLIIAARYDKSRLPNPRRGMHRHHSASRTA